MTADGTPGALNVQIKDIRGTRYGRLLVKEFDRSENSRRFWLCVCDCGKTKSIDGGSLKRGFTTSCGCFRSEASRARVLTHGMTGTAEFRIWTGMKDRTTNPKCEHYQIYGGRGVLVCPEWFDSFDKFFADMGPRPSARHSIDRVDPNKAYCKENCRWATGKEQCRNKRNNHLVEYLGEKLPIAAWTERFGFRKNTIRNRLVAGWSIHDSMMTPEKEKRPFQKRNGRKAEEDLF